jgi:putative ABC transport system substrate-binding protein
MKRRDLIALLGGTALWLPISPVAASDGVRRVSVLMGIGENDPEAQPRIEALLDELQKLGWTDGRDIHLDYRWAAGDLDRIQLFAKEIVELKPDVIVAHSTPVVAALRQLTSTIPIVFVLIADPIGSGFVASLARPGGNLTGFMNVDAPMAGKWLEFLKQIAPDVGRVALIFNPRTSPYKPYLSEFQANAPTFGVEAIATPVVDAAELEREIAKLGQTPQSALFVVPDVFVQVHRALIIKLAEQNRLPAIYPYSFFPASGGLLSYGIDTVAVFRRAASYIDRILKGAAPADLPVQGPTTFKLVINLKAAQAIGLTIPQVLLVRADEVIE